MNNVTVLVIDDDPVIRKLLEQRLIKENYNVLVAEDGNKGNDILLSNNHIDVVLTDLMMPGDIGGIEILELANNLERNIEVILITAHSSVDTAVEAMKKGAADYLEKPINFTELFLRLDKLSTMRSLARSAEDLRQAMDVTESCASATIQKLEITAASLQDKIDRIEAILISDTIQAEEKIEDSLQLISKGE